MPRLHRSIALAALLGACSAVGCNSLRTAASPQKAPETPVAKVSEKKSEEFQKAASKLENPSAVFLAYARMQERQGMVAQARQSYGFVLREQPDSRDAMLGLARLDQLADRHQEAEQRFQQVAQLHRDDATAQEALGQFYASRQRWNEAIPVLRRAANLAPDATSIRYNLGVSLAHAGDVEAARSHFVSTVGRAAAHYNLGHILMEEGRFEASERELIAAIQANPELEEAQTLLGELRAQRGDTQIASGGRTPSLAIRQTAAAAPRHPTRPTAVRDAQYRRPRTASPNEQFEPLPSWVPGARQLRPTGEGELSAAQREQLRNQSGY